MKLSLIIPIYGVEKYIKKFMESLIYQVTSEVEVILVNDGTCDRSMIILNNIINSLNIEKKSCFKILEQKNFGQSIARNNGLKFASGEYIGFLDADDLVASDYIDTLLNCMKKEADIISYNALAFNDLTNEKLWNLNSNIASGYYNKDVNFLKFAFKECSWQPWLRIFKKDLIQNNYFPSDVFLEDVHFCVEAYLRADSIHHVNKELVLYRQRPDSSIKILSQKLVDSYKAAINFLESKATNYPYVKYSINKLQIHYYYHLFETEDLAITLKKLFTDNVVFYVKCRIIFKILKFYLLKFDKE